MQYSTPTDLVPVGTSPREQRLTGLGATNTTRMYGGNNKISEEQLFADLHRTGNQKKFNRRLKKGGYDPMMFDQYLAQDPAWAAKNPERAAAALARSRYDMFEKDFRGYEDEVLDFASDKGLPERMADQAGQDVARSFDHELSQGQADRRLTRRGISADSETTDQASRGRDLMRAASMVSAGNTARRTYTDIQGAAATDMSNIGQGLSAGAMQSLNAAGGMASQRNMTNDAARAGARQSMVGTAATGAMAGAYWGATTGAVAGPVGALIGAGLGAAISYAGTR